MNIFRKTLNFVLQGLVAIGLLSNLPGCGTDFKIAKDKEEEPPQEENPEQPNEPIPDQPQEGKVPDKGATQEQPAKIVSSSIATVTDDSLDSAGQEGEKLPDTVVTNDNTFTDSSEKGITKPQIDTNNDNIRDTEADKPEAVTPAQNIAPIANAGDNITVTDSDNSGSETVTLDGSASTDQDGNIVSYSWTDANGTEISTDPNPNVSLDVGVHELTLTVTDNEGATSSDTVQVAVNAAANNPPLAEPDSFITDEDVPITLDLLTNDSDVDGDALSIATIGTPQHGTLTVNANGTYTYTPDSNYAGDDGFEYTVTDGKGGTSTTSVDITINPVNDAPEFNNTAIESSAQEFYDNFSDPYVLGAITATDPEGTAVTYEITSSDFPGAFTIDNNNGEISVSDPYLSTVFVSGSEYELTVKATDSTGLENTQNVKINIID